MFFNVINSRHPFSAIVASVTMAISLVGITTASTKIMAEATDRVVNLSMDNAKRSLPKTEFGLAFTPLLTQPQFTAQRAARYLKVELHSAHRVLSTSDIEGGQSDDLRYLVNHQSMEAVNDAQRMDYILSRSDQTYHREVAETLAIVPEQMALMGTAANMNNVAHAQASFGELRVDAFVSAGVSANAMRAGDEARWAQTDEGNQFIGSKGTINTILLINHAMTAGAQTKAAMVMVEAKTAALMELAVASKQSSHLATGTGTDQFIVASPLDNGRDIESKKPLTSASGHLKLGELIGTAVRQATLEALRWQNALEPSTTASLIHALSRFGMSEASIKTYASEFSDTTIAGSYFSEDDHTRFADNLSALIREPRVTASAYAVAAVLDRFQYQSLPLMTAQESLRDQAANMAVAVCGDPSRWTEFWQLLAPSSWNSDFKQRVNDKARPIPEIDSLMAQALLLGWQCKWR